MSLNISKTSEYVEETNRQQNIQESNKRVEELCEKLKDELKIIYNQPVPKDLELITDLYEVEDCKALALCSIYNWGLIQGKRAERTRRKYKG